MKKMSQKLALQDVLASFVVFLVAIPLCLGIAIASGLPPTTGLLSGIIGGLVVCWLGGCSLQVSGPAAGLVAIVWEATQAHGVEKLGAIILLAGVMQIVFARVRMGQWFRAVSPAVVQGMLAGIGVLIFASQFHVMFDDTPHSKGLENILSIPEAIYKGIFPLDGSTHHLAAAIGLLTIITIVLWENFRPRRLKLLPAPLIGVLVAVGTAAMYQLPINYIEVPTNILDSIRWVSGQDLLSVLASPALLTTVITIAIIASTESLLTATAVDKLTAATGCRTNYDRELFAQGVGNTLAGMIGALPITGVIVRSSANVQAGAVSRASGILHGLWLVVFLVFLPFLLEFIPIASLAAILVYTGYKLINPAGIRALLQFGKSEVVIYAVTIVAIVMTNLLEGILIGFALSIIRLLITLSSLQVETTIPQGKDCLLVFLKGSANFISLPQLSGSLEAIAPGQEVHVYLKELNHIDHACIEFLLGWQQSYQQTGGTVHLEWSTLAVQLPPKCGVTQHAGVVPTEMPAATPGSDPI